jgi:hypothetical protein
MLLERRENMIVILNSKTHVGANPPSDTTKTWISADMTEISIYPEPETYGRLNTRIDVKAILLAHNLDIKSDRVRVFSLADDVLEVKRYINGEWIVIDNPNDYVDIIMNGKVIGTMEVDTIAPGEEVEEWDGTGVVIEATETEEPEDELAGTWTFVNNPSGLTGGTTWNVNFTSNNGQQFSRLSKGWNSSKYSGYIKYDDESAYPWTSFSGDSFRTEAWQTIVISSKLLEVTDGSSLLTWLKTNATKQ